MIRGLVCVVAVSVTLFGSWPGSFAVAANWGHWRGEDGNSVSSTATPPTEWSDSQNVKWKVPVPGSGSGSPVVWEDQVFVVTAAPVDANADPRLGLIPLKFMLLCYDRSSGELQWQRTAIEATPHEGTHTTNGFASASPCTDGQRIYAHFGSRGLFCYTMDGDLVWKRDFGRMTTRATFGEGSSPTLVDDWIIVPWDHEGPSYLFALNKLTGETVWQTPRDEPTCWATPLVVEVDGQKQIIMNGQNRARAYALKTGKELWSCGGQTQRPVASAVAGGNLVFVGSGFRGAFLGAFRPDGAGELEGTQKIAWTVDKDTPDIASPLLSGNRLYFFKAKTGILSCINANTGEYFYSNQRTGLSTLYASPVAADGLLYISDRDGKTVVIKDSEEFEVVASNEIGETIDATPAPVDDQLFIRGENHLFCIQN